MNLQELLLKTIEENDLVRKNFMEEIEEETEKIIDISTETEEFKKAVLEYMSLQEIELNQQNYDCVSELLRNSEEGSFHHITKTKKEISTLGEYSLEDLKDIIQVCILKQCEKLCELLDVNQKREYEYAIERVLDDRGATDVKGLAEIISYYAKEGWRVKNVFTNERGKNLTSVAVGGVSSGINYTTDEVVIIFERLKQKTTNMR